MDLLDAFAEAKKAAKVSPEAAVNKLYELTVQEGFYWGEPDEMTSGQILTTFAGWVEQEKNKQGTDKAERGSRSDAIKHIAAKLSGSKTVAFTGIPAGVFGVQLAMRVRRPRSVQQGNTALCGAASTMYLFAKTRPLEYAKFALKLFLKGKANYGDMPIEPSTSVLANYRARQDALPWAVDYVTMVSLRESIPVTSFFGSLATSSLRAANETAMPGQVAQWLQAAGYTQVRDRTFFASHQTWAVGTAARSLNQPLHHGQGGDPQAGESFARARDNLKEARDALYSHKMHVVLFIDSAVSQAMQDGVAESVTPRSGLTSLGDHHWMVARKIALIAKTHVRIAGVTWGAKYEGKFDVNAFLPRYNGFIAAKP